MNENKQAEPVACIGTNGELVWLNKPSVIYNKPIPLYAHPAQPVQPAVNEQLLEAAKMAKSNIHSARLCCINSMSSRSEMLRLMEASVEQLGAAIAAAEVENAKGGRDEL